MKLMNISKPVNFLAVFTVLFSLVLTGCEKDADPGVRPTVVSTSPANNATDVAVNANISATFSTAMNASSTSKFSLSQAGIDVAGLSELNGTALSFTPAVDLLPNTVYIATISKSAANAGGTTLLADHSWTFTTGVIPDVTLPTVTLLSPANAAIGVSLDHAVVFTFSEPMDASTINATTFTLKQGTTVIEGDISLTGTTATFTPSADLDNNKVYTATITTEAKDMAGNALSADQTLIFTTALDVLAPLVHSADPQSDATGIARNKVVTVTFSETMNASTINSSTLILKQGINLIPGAVTYANMVATFAATSILDAGLIYTVTITTGAEDMAGNALEDANEWSFTTGNNASTPAVVELGEAGNYVILAKTAINNSSTSEITGDLGLSPAATTYITGLALTDATGYATSSQVTGTVYAADMADPTPVNLTTAVENMITAYNDAAGRPSPDFLELATGNIGGRTLSSGLYKWTSTVTLPSDVVISGGANDVWIFQIAGDLTMSSAVNITLTGGAQAKNIFWQVAGEATIGTTAHFEGVILSMTGITFQTGASINGRALAQTAVILDSNAVTEPQ
jgi:hypothetical protein